MELRESIVSARYYVTANGVIDWPFLVSADVRFSGQSRLGTSL